jgi:transcriptional adapter 3
MCKHGCDFHYNCTHTNHNLAEGAAKPKALSQIDTSTPYDSPSPSKKLRLSPDTSPLSEVENSPDASPGKSVKASSAKSDVSMDNIEENRVIHKPPTMPQQGFFPDPLAPDPIIYHIRDVTPGMTDAERKEIYSVTGFPTKDLSDQIAGIPPDKDFSNAKPTNQVAANTFLTYVEPYVRPLTEEDMAFLRERGDRNTPFLNVSRGKRHYTEVWADEDGIPFKQDPDKLSANQGRGSLDSMTDALSSTDEISTGPLHARLLSLLKFEHRSTPTENGVTTNGDIDLFANANDDTMDLDGLANGQEDGEKPLPVAASVADLTGSKSALLKRLDWPDSDERLKNELRYLNFLGPDENIGFDAHNDDDISERLRLLQAELRRVMIVNGARKSRLEKIAQERLAFQEYSTIHEDLDTQVQQAYLKRTRTLGKSKKGGPGGGKPRPGQAALVNGVGINRARDIGDNARILMDRRDRWDKCIGPVFQNMSHGVPGKGTTLFDPRIMGQLEKDERERLDDEGD